MFLFNISASKIYESGQTFRWIKLNDNEFLIPHKSSIAHVIEDESGIEIKTVFGEEFDWSVYFDCARDYVEIDKRILLKYPYLKTAVEFSRGMRILNQDPFEMLITFIISANNNIKRISATVGDLCKNYGIKATELNNSFNFDNATSLNSKKIDCMYLFPTLDSFSKISADIYKLYGAGYRASYLESTVKELIEKKINLSDFDALSDDELLKELMKFKGVGPKVARCIALFGFSRFEMFPVDTWIKKAIRETLVIEDESLKGINMAIDDEFDMDRGLIQQYLFYYFRSSKQ